MTYNIPFFCSLMYMRPSIFPQLPRRETFPQWTYVPTRSYWTHKPRQPCCKPTLNCKCRYYDQTLLHSLVVTKRQSSCCLFTPQPVTPPRYPDGSKRCEPPQRLHAAHAGTPSRQEPLLGFARAQEPLSERHTPGAHHVLWRGPEETTQGEICV